MFTRLRRALLALVADPSAPCPRCAELERLAEYFRQREERATDRLLESKGVVGTAHAPAAAPVSPMSQAMRALAVTEIDTTKKRPTSQPGQGAFGGNA